MEQAQRDKGQELVVDWETAIIMQMEAVDWDIEEVV